MPPVQYSAFASLRSLAIAVGLLLGITSCVPRQIDLTESPFRCPSLAVPELSTPVSNLPLDIEVHVDGSGSMLGYVPETTVGQETVYTDTLETLHQVFTAPRAGSSPPKYFRTGLNRETQSSTEEFSFNDRTPGRLNPLTQNFYAGRLTSQLQAAITAPETDRNKLLVLISDLDQDSGAINYITQAIQDNFFGSTASLKSNYGIALLGIRSQFSGTVFSTDPSKIKDFPYESETDPATYRPFYLLWVGPITELNQYLPDLVSKLQQQGETLEVSLFSPTDWQTELIFNSQQFPDLPDGIRIRTLKKDQVVIVSENNPGHLFSLSSRSKDNLTIRYELSSQRDYSQYLVGIEKVETQVQGWDFSSTQDPLERSSREVSAELELTNFQPQPQGLDFDLLLHPQEIASSSLYVYRFDLLANGLTTPEWWEAWDWGSRESETDGTKTYQLRRFTDSLGTITLDAMGEDKTIGTVCFAVQK
jgi:hypothetical protein